MRRCPCVLQLMSKRHLWVLTSASFSPRGIGLPLGPYCRSVAPDSRYVLELRLQLR